MIKKYLMLSLCSLLMWGMLGGDLAAVLVHASSSTSSKSWFDDSTPEAMLDSLVDMSNSDFKIQDNKLNKINAKQSTLAP